MTGDGSVRIGGRFEGHALTAHASGLRSISPANPVRRSEVSADAKTTKEQDRVHLLQGPGFVVDRKSIQVGGGIRRLARCEPSG